MSNNIHRPRRVFAVVVAVALLTLTAMIAPISPAGAEYHDQPDFVWGVEGGDVRAITRIGNTIYVGGSFDEVKEPGAGTHAQARLAAFDAVTGQWRSAFDPDIDNTVRDLASSSDGSRLFVVGHFKYVNGVKRRGIVSLDPVTGAVDPAFDAEAWGNGKAVEVDGTDVYVSGGFGQVGGGIAIPRLARLDAVTGDPDTTWVPRPDNGPEGLSIPPAGGVLYLAGPVALDGVTNPNNAAISRVSLTTGRRDASFNPTRATPARDVDSTDTRVFVAHGGSNHFRMFDAADGDMLVDYDGDGDFQRTEIIGKRAYVGSHSSELGALDRLQLAAVDYVTGAPALSFDTPVSGGHGVRAIYGAGSNLHLGGQISRVGGVQMPGDSYARVGPAPGQIVPTVVTGLTTVGDEGQITVSWTASTDDGTVVGYRVLRAGQQVALTTATSFVDHQVQAGVDYVYEVEALDDDDNLGPTSSSVIGSTEDDEPPPDDTTAALIVANPAAPEQLDQLAQYLLTVNGVQVDLVDDDAVAASDFSSYDLVNVGRSVSSDKVGSHLNHLTAPVVVNKPYLYDNIGLTGPTAGVDYGLRNFSTLDLDPTHPVAVGLPDPLVLVNTPLSAGWGSPAVGADVIGALDTGEAVVFLYEAGALLADGTSAPGCRAAFPANVSYLEQMTSDAFGLTNRLLNHLLATC